MNSKRWLGLRERVVRNWHVIRKFNFRLVLPVQRSTTISELRQFDKTASTHQLERTEDSNFKDVCSENRIHGTDPVTSGG